MDLCAGPSRHANANRQTIEGAAEVVRSWCARQSYCSASKTSFSADLYFIPDPCSPEVLSSRACTSPRSSDCWSIAPTKPSAARPRARTLHLGPGLELSLTHATQGWHQTTVAQQVTPIAAGVQGLLRASALGAARESQGKREALGMSSATPPATAKHCRQTGHATPAPHAGSPLYHPSYGALAVGRLTSVATTCPWALSSTRSRLWTPWTLHMVSL